MTNQQTQLPSLPYEVRELIWEFSLPAPRLFSVKAISHVKLARFCPEPHLYDACFGNQKTRGWTTIGASDSRTCLIFHKRHPPPVITNICQESRNLAIRAGYFVLPTLREEDEDRVRMTWFNGPTDILCYSVIGARRQLAHLNELPYFVIPNLARVRNVGVESDYLLSAPLAVEGIWDAVQDRLLAVYAHIPRVKGLYVIRASLSVAGDHESGGEELQMARMVPLPLSTLVVYNGEFRPWEDVLLDLDRTLGTEEMVQRWQALFGVDVCFPPELSLHSLSRAI